MPENNSEIKKRALDLYKPPFTFNSRLGWIFDGNGKQVSDKIDDSAVMRIRGRGR